MPGWRKTLLQVLASGSLTVLALGALELGLDALDLPPSGLYAGDPASVWWLAPDLERTVEDPVTGRSFAVRTDEQGRRGPPPPETGPWVLALGCSTTFGWGVEREEAWPARLSERLGVPVVNAGQPGWSTHQARARAPQWLAEGPAVVVLGFLIRDAWRTGRPDRAARPTPWLQRRRLARLLQPAPSPTAPARTPPDTGQHRVAPSDYRENLEDLISAARPAAVVLLEFPHQHATPEHAAVLTELARTTGLPHVAPEVGAELFLDGDPIHLSPVGHEKVAARLAPVVSAALEQAR